MVNRISIEVKGKGHPRLELADNEHLVEPELRVSSPSDSDHESAVSVRSSDFTLYYQWDCTARTDRACLWLPPAYGGRVEIAVEGSTTCFTLSSTPIQSQALDLRIEGRRSAVHVRDVVAQKIVLGSQTSTAIPEEMISIGETEQVKAAILLTRVRCESLSITSSAHDATAFRHGHCATTTVRHLPERSSTNRAPFFALDTAISKRLSVSAGRGEIYLHGVTVQADRQQQGEFVPVELNTDLGPVTVLDSSSQAAMRVRSSGRVHLENLHLGSLLEIEHARIVGLRDQRETIRLVGCRIKQLGLEAQGASITLDDVLVRLGCAVSTQRVGEIHLCGVSVGANAAQSVGLDAHRGVFSTVNGQISCSERRAMPLGLSAAIPIEFSTVTGHLALKAIQSTTRVTVNHEGRQMGEDNDLPGVAIQDLDAIELHVETFSASVLLARARIEAGSVSASGPGHIQVTETQVCANVHQRASERRTFKLITDKGDIDLTPDSHVNQGSSVWTNVPTAVESNSGRVSAFFVDSTAPFCITHHECPDAEDRAEQDLNKIFLSSARLYAIIISAQKASVRLDSTEISSTSQIVTGAPEFAPGTLQRAIGNIEAQLHLSPSFSGHVFIESRQGIAGVHYGEWRAERSVTSTIHAAYRIAYVWHRSSGWVTIASQVTGTPRNATRLASVRFASHLLASLTQERS